MDFLFKGSKQKAQGQQPAQPQATATMGGGGMGAGIAAALAGKAAVKAGMPGAGGQDLVKESSTAAFMTDVIEASRQVPVIVDFWAPWCGPCKTLGPALEKLVREAKGAVRMVKINVDENQQLAQQMRIQSIPAVYAFFDGRPVDGFVGAVPESQLKSFIQRLLQAAAGAGGAPVDLTEVLAEAKTLLDQGDVQNAAQIYQQVLGEDPENVPAIAGLLRCQIKAGDVTGAQELLAELPPEIQAKPEIVSVKTSLDVAAEAAGKIAQTAELQRRLAANPNDHQARIDMATALFAMGDRETALEELLEAIRRDRMWNEEAARKQLVKLFEAIGLTDPLTISARRQLSSILFS
jgi:putative thioredoxin